MRQVVYSLSTFTVVVIALRVGAAFAGFVALAGVVLLVRRWLAQPGEIRLQRSLPARAFHGDELTVQVRATNSGRPVHWLEVADLVPQALRTDAHSSRHVLTLDRDDDVTFSYDIRCARRGRYRVGPLGATSGDLFGLKAVELSPVPADTIVVYPRIVALSALGIPARAPIASIKHRHSLVRDPARLRGLRGYQPGDPRRSIHWPATARSGEIQVKQHDPAIARATVICLNLILPYYPRGRKTSGVEYAVTAAASLAHHIVTVDRLDAGLAVAGASGSERSTRLQVPVGGGRPHLMTMLETLAQVEPTTEGRFVTAVDSAITDLPWGATVVLITPWVTDDLAATILGIRSRGFVPTVLLVQPTAEAEEQCARLGAAGVRVVPVEVDSDLVSLT